MFDTVIHMKPSALESVNNLGLKWEYSKQHGFEEIDVFVKYLDDSQLTLTDDPDVLLVEHYELDYDQVNCIEAM